MPQGQQFRDTIEPLLAQIALLRGGHQEYKEGSMGVIRVGFHFPQQFPQDRQAERSQLGIHQDGVILSRYSGSADDLSEEIVLRVDPQLNQLYQVPIQFLKTESSVSASM